jgi:hypothetical protein
MPDSQIKYILLLVQNNVPSSPSLPLTGCDFRKCPLIDYDQERSRRIAVRNTEEERQWSDTSVVVVSLFRGGPIKETTCCKSGPCIHKAAVGRWYIVHEEGFKHVRLHRAVGTRFSSDSRICLRSVVLNNCALTILCHITGIYIRKIQILEMFAEALMG